jgi:hypothetical protein
MSTYTRQFEHARKPDEEGRWRADPEVIKEGRQRWLARLAEKGEKVMKMRFKDLAEGDTFEFDHRGLSTSCLAMAHGPWIKVSARRYRKEDGAPILHTVGTINVAVRIDAGCGGWDN